jgi:uncharacterized protein (DUF58 family)
MKPVIDEAFLQQLDLFSLSVKDNVAGLFGGNHKSKKYGSSCEFADYRDYIEGDDVTKIDWNLYGKFEKLYLKLFLDERQMHTRIYIDCSDSMSYYGKGEYGLKLAAAFSYLSVTDMDKVTVYAIEGNYARPVIENMVGKDSYLSSISALNGLKFQGQSQIAAAMERSTVGYGDGRSILISDFLTDEDFRHAIDHLREKRRDVLVLQILSQEEMHPVLRGKYLLRDSEDTDRTFKANITRDQLQAYQKAVDYVTKGLENYCRAREADYMLVSTAENMKDVLYRGLLPRGIVA